MTTYIIDPDFSKDSGHHPKLNDALYAYSAENHINVAFLTRDDAKTSRYKISPIFKNSCYISNSDWLTWINTTLNRANMFRSELKMYIEPISKNEGIHLLLHSATLPMVIGLAEWLVTLPEKNAPKKLGLHFHIEPYFGNTPLESTQKLATESLNKIYEYMKKIKGTFLLSAQHPSISKVWEQSFSGKIKNFPTPTLFEKVKRQRHSSMTRLLFIGNLRSSKNIELLLQAAKPLLDNLPNLEIKIVTSSTNMTIDINETMPKERLEIIQSSYIEDRLYYQEIVDADIVWCLYDKNKYGSRASNIFWEAQAHVPRAIGG